MKTAACNRTVCRTITEIQVTAERIIAGQSKARQAEMQGRISESKK